MAWKKIDDEQTAGLSYQNMSYSAFLANGLTTNANCYNTQLTRGGGIAWNAHDKVVWASYHRPQGVMFTVNVGQQVTQIDFRVKYATITASVDANGFQGSVFLTHLSTGEFVEVGLLPTAGAESYFDVQMTLTVPASGPQAFSLTFRSSKLLIKGLVDIQGGVENTVYLNQRGGPSAYPITAGEKFELLSLATANSLVNTTGPSYETGVEFQINYVNTTGPHPPDGYASVFPTITGNPPRLSASYNNTNNGFATIYELGALQLLSIAYNVVFANQGTAPAQYAHNSASALAQVINIQNVTNRALLMDLATVVSQRFSLGATIAGATTIPVAQAAQKLSFTFSCGAAAVESELCLTFNAFTLYYASNQEIRIRLYDAAGTQLYTAKQSVLAPSDRTQQCVVGITARGWYESTSGAQWGMRDSMPDEELLLGSPQTFIIPSITYQPDTPYTIVLESVLNQTAFYVYNLYARFITSAG